MESGLVFWDKYFKSQVEVTWDEFSQAFSKLLLEYGKIQLDQDQLLIIKSLIDPDYRNIVKIAHFLIFQDTFWKIQSKKQALFKHQLQTPIFEIPPQIMNGLKLKIIQIAKGYAQGDRDIQINRTQFIKSSQPLQNLDPQTIISPYVQSIYIVQTPQEEFQLKNEEVFIIGSSDSKCDFVIKNDLQMNQMHLKLIWTPYNLFLIRDISKSFRTTLRLQPNQYYLLDYLSVYKLGPETAFYVKQIQPLPHFRDEYLQSGVRYIETAQEHNENYIPYLVKQLETHRFQSVMQYRHSVDQKEIETSHWFLEKQLNQLQNSNINQAQLQLEFISGPIKGKSFNLDNIKTSEYIIGRSNESQICIPDQLLQDKQIKIFYNQDFGWLIEHLQKPDVDNVTDPTVFGTFLLLANKLQLDLSLPSRAHVIQEGMVISIGPYLFEAQYQKL